ncbi:MAG: 1-acylglycerol-3-phosphate O-acyltransferase [Lachnospiraceae bacterium]|nr:1-acylglycerol-3-phosphate O-acyltransferase [Lachnospiraceae bacterium]
MIRAILAILFAIVFLILSLPIYAVTALFRKKHPEAIDRFSQKLVCWALRVVSAICCVHLEVRGQENLKKDQAVLYIGNHASIFDVILVYPLLPGLTGFLAKKELDHVPILNLWLRRINGLFLDRNDPKQGLQTILTAIDYVKKGISIFIFPEGTRTKDGKLGEFKAGSFKVATRTKCPIIPVAIENTADIIRKHMPFVHTTHVIITFGKPILVEKLNPEEKKHIGPYVQKIVAGMLKQEVGEKVEKTE